MFVTEGSRRVLRHWECIDLFNKIAKEYGTKEATEKLAFKLLEGKIPGGAAGFISNRSVNGRAVDWDSMASDVLKHWSYLHEDVDVLVDALQEVNPTAATLFTVEICHKTGERLFSNVISLSIFFVLGVPAVPICCVWAALSKKKTKT